MTAIWDREPLWHEVRRILESNGTCTAGEIAKALEMDGWQTGPDSYKVEGRVYQLLRERIATGEVLTVQRKEGRAKGYTLSQGMPKLVLHIDAYYHAELHRIARKIRRPPEEVARRLLLAGIKYQKEVLQ